MTPPVLSIQAARRRLNPGLGPPINLLVARLYGNGIMVRTPAFWASQLMPDLIRCVTQQPRKRFDSPNERLMLSAMVRSVKGSHMVEQPSSLTADLNCLRCPGVELRRLPESTKDIMFFECRSCQRQYAQRLGRSLTYRWGHPVTLPLYIVLFDSEPWSRAQATADHFLKACSRDELARMIEEIDLELHHPTQNVRDILDNRASEEKCREFLHAFVTHVRSAL